jgi:hypothetical protein
MRDSAAKLDPGATLAHESFMRRTHQVWKLHLVLGWLPLVGVCVVLATFFDLLGRTPTQKAVFVIVGAVIVLAADLLGAVSIRCPTCNTSLYWRAMSGTSFRQWISWLLSLSSCPVCGNNGSYRS